MTVTNGKSDQVEAGKRQGALLDQLRSLMGLLISGLGPSMGTFGHYRE